jgi:hypothetical protein
LAVAPLLPLLQMLVPMSPVGGNSNSNSNSDVFSSGSGWCDYSSDCKRPACRACGLLQAKVVKLEVSDGSSATHLRAGF